MDYDNWKLQAPDYDEEVTVCCGTEGDGYECTSCGNEASYISESDYDKEKMYNWYETLRD